jgi:hypothetical protein
MGSVWGVFVCRCGSVILAGNSSSDGLQQQLSQLQQALQQRLGLEQGQVQGIVGLGSSSGSVGPGELQQMQEVFAAPPTLEQLLQQRWEQVCPGVWGKVIFWGLCTEGNAWGCWWHDKVALGPAMLSVEQGWVWELLGQGSSIGIVGPGELQAVFAAPPALEELLQQRWKQCHGCGWGLLLWCTKRQENVWGS